MILSKDNNTPLMAAFCNLMRRTFDGCGDLAKPVTVHIAGGMAMHFHVGERSTSDVDLFLDARMIVRNSVMEYVDAFGRPRTLCVDGTYSPTLGLLHPDYADKSVPLGDISGLPGISFRVLHPLDLAVTKLARFDDTDRTDIGTLGEHLLIGPDDLRARALEAMEYYIGDLRWLKMNLEEACCHLRDLEARLQEPGLQ